MASAATNRGLIGILKRGWNEVPEIVGSSIIGLIGIGFCVMANINYQKRDGDNRPYKSHYTVYRHDDPRVATLKTQCDSTSCDK